MDKLEELKKKIQNYKKRHEKKTYKRNDFHLNAFNVSLEIITAVAVGLLIGFYLDKVFELKVVFKILCLLLAFIASLVNIYRTINRR
jgi:F0F1-type ATP synthase assembly protein I